MFLDQKFWLTIFEIKNDFLTPNITVYMLGNRHKLHNYTKIITIIFILFYTSKLLIQVIDYNYSYLFFLYIFLIFFHKVVFFFLSYL